MDLRAALLTPPGEGGISVIAVVGAKAARFVEGRLRDRKGTPRPLVPGTLSYGFFHSDSGEVLDEVIVACADQGYVEINCHGGAIPARRVMESLAAAGVRIVDAGEIPALSGGRIEAEAAEAVRGAVTELAARVFAAQLGGVLAQAVEAAIAALAQEPADVGGATATLSSLIDSARIGLALAEPRSVAVLGPVNAGKSTLVNAMAGFERNIVGPVAGTTRDAVEVHVSLFGVPVTLIDTAGAGLAETALDAIAQRRASDASRASDAALIVIDASAELPEGFAPPSSQGGTVVAANKSDIAPNAATLSSVAAWGAPVVRVSGMSGAGLDCLSGAILAALDIPVPSKGIATQPIIFRKRQLECAAEARRALGESDTALAIELLRLLR